MHPVWNRLNQKHWYNSFVKIDDDQLSEEPIDYFQKSIYSDLLVDTFSYDSVHEKNSFIEINEINNQDQTYFQKLFTRAVNQKLKKSTSENGSIKKIKLNNGTSKSIIQPLKNKEDIFGIFKQNKKWTGIKRNFSNYKSFDNPMQKFQTKKKNNIFELDFFIFNLIQWIDDISIIPRLLCLNRNIFDTVNCNHVWKHLYYSQCFIPLKYEYKFELNRFQSETFFHVNPAQDDKLIFKNENDMKNLCFFVRSVLYKKIYNFIKTKTQQSGQIENEYFLKDWKIIEIHQIIRKMCDIEDYDKCMKICKMDKTNIDYYCYLRSLYPHVKNMPKNPQQKLNCCLTNIFLNRHFLNKNHCSIMDMFFGKEKSHHIQKTHKQFEIKKTKHQDTYLFLHDIAKNTHIDYNEKYFKENQSCLNLPIQYTFFYDMISRHKMIDVDKMNCIKEFSKKTWVDFLIEKLNFKSKEMEYFDLIRSQSFEKINESKSKIKWNPKMVDFLTFKSTNKFNTTILSDMIVSECFHVLDWCLPIEWKNSKKNNLFVKKIINPQNILSLFLQNDFGIHIMQLIYYLNINWKYIDSCFKKKKHEQLFKQFWLFFRNMQTKTDYFVNFDYKKDDNDFIHHENHSVKNPLNIWFNWKMNQHKRLDYCSNNKMTNTRPFVLIDLKQLIINEKNCNLWKYISKNILKFKFRQIYRSDHKSSDVKFEKNKVYLWDDCTFEKLMYYKLFQYKCIHQKSNYKIHQNDLKKNEPDLLYQLIICNEMPQNNCLFSRNSKTHVHFKDHSKKLINEDEINQLVSDYGKPYNHPLLWNLHTDQLCNVSYNNTFFKFKHSNSETTRKYFEHLNSEMTHKNWYHSLSEKDICAMEHCFYELMEKNNINRYEIPFDRMIKKLFVDKKLCKFYNQESYALMFTTLNYLIRKKWYTKPNLWIHWLFGLSYNEWKRMIDDVGIDEKVIRCLNDVIEFKNKFSKKELKQLIVNCDEKYVEIGWWLCSHYKNNRK